MVEVVPREAAVEGGLPVPPEAGAPAAASPRQGARLIERRIKTRGPSLSPVVIRGLVQAGEFLAVAGLGFAIFLAYVGADDAIETAMYALASVAAAGATVLVFQSFGLYSIHAFSSYARQLTRLAVAWTIVFAGLAALAFFAKSGAEYSRFWGASWYLSGLVMVLGLRLALTRQVRHWTRQGRLNRRAVIVGGGAPCEALIAALEASPDTDVRICGIFDDRGHDRISPVVAGYPKLGKIDELIAFGRRAHIDLLIVSLPITAENRLLELLKKLWVLPVDIRLSAHTNKLRFRPRAYSYIGNVPFIDVFDKPIRDWDFVLKWLFDKTVATLGLLAAAPVMALVATAIKLESRGPVLFKQRRYGFNNELIEVYKFRSMYADQADADASRLVTRDDPRITRVGRFIRKTSLDELPQLFNVFKGELSVVGPRPHALQAKAASALYNEVVDGYFARHRVKPGITGWAQINGWRGETDTPEKIQRRVEHDLYYIENWSVLFDLYIVLATPFALLRAENAY